MKPSAKRCLDYLNARGTWTALYELQHPAIGGTSADRRVRELRAEGVPVEWRYSSTPGSRCTYYRVRQSEPVQMELAV